MFETFLLKLFGHRCPEPIKAIRFSRSTLCVECDHITESRGSTCDKCGASSVCLVHMGEPLRLETFEGLLQKAERRQLDNRRLADLERRSGCF